MRLVLCGFGFVVLSFAAMLAPAQQIANAQNTTAPQTGKSDTGFAVKRPIFGGSCPTCPWGSIAEIVRAALKPYGWDVQICYYCAGGARAARLVAGAAMATPPANPTPDTLPTPKGPVDFGATGTQLLWWAYQGSNMFAKDPEGPRKQLRLIANIQQPVFLAVAVKEDSGITDLRQIVEKRLPVRILESDIMGDMPLLMDYFGLTKEKVESFGGELRTSATPENRKNVDVIIGWASLVDAPEFNMWYEVTQKNDLKFLRLPDDLLDKLAKQFEYERRDLPLGLLRGVDKPVPTVARTGTAIYGRNDMPDDFAYIVAKALDDHQDLLQWSNGGLNFPDNWHTVWKAYGVPFIPVRRATTKKRLHA